MASIHDDSVLAAPAVATRESPVLTGVAKPAADIPTVHCRIRMSYLPDSGERDYALYQVHVTLPNGASWSVHKRYSEFLHLEKELEATLGPAEKELFPPKHRLASSKDHAVVEERLNRLPLWLIAVSRHVHAAMHPAFREFFEVNQHDSAVRQSLSAAGGDSMQPYRLWLETGYAQPGAQPEVKEVVLHGRTHDVTGIAIAPPHAGDELATATTSVDVRVPRVDTRPAKRALQHATEAVDETLAAAHRAQELDQAAIVAEQNAVQEQESAQTIVQQASLLQARVVDAERQEELAANKAAALEAEARRIREEAECIGAEKNATASRLHSLEREAEARMHEFEVAVARAQDLKGLALRMHEQTMTKKREALEAHEHAALEVQRAETTVKEAAGAEEHRQVAAAAAAAATARRALTQAAMLKAAEEASLTKAWLAAEEEAEAAAQLALAEEKLELARRNKLLAEEEAAVAQKECKAFTEAAAKAAAEVDAHSNAASAMREQANRAERILAHAASEVRAVHRLAGADAVSTPPLGLTPLEHHTTTAVVAPTANFNEFMAGKPAVVQAVMDASAPATAASAASKRVVYV